MVGRTIGKYRIVEQIGRGGMGTVYKAIDETLDRSVAIKLLNADLIDQDAVERFRREAMTLAKLSHGRIGAIHELTRDGHDLLMVMEYLEGETFEKLIERGPMPVPRAVALCTQVLDALQYAHAAGVVHRDLKPANVMLTPAGDVKIMDFGIARVQGSEHLTTNGFMVGTPAYMAPEQVRGEEVDPRMDLYAIAVVLYRMLTQHLPFHGDTAIAMIHSQLNNPPTPPRQFRTDLPEWVIRVIDRGLAKKPADRFQTAAEFRTALENGLTGRMPIVPSTDTTETIGPMLTPPSMRAPATASAVTSSPATDASVAPPPFTASAPVPAPAPTMAQATVTLRAPQLATAGILLALLVVGVGVLAFVALRRPTGVTTPPAVVATQPAPAATADTSAPSPAPPAETAPVTTPPEPTSPPVSTAAATPAAPAVPPPSTTPKPAPAASTSTPASTSSGARSGTPNASPGGATAATGRGTTASASVPVAPVAPVVPAAPAAASAPAENFGDIKTLVVDGTKSREVDALLSLEPGNLIVRSRSDGSVLRSVPYTSIAAATYARARRPRGQTTPGAYTVPENVGGSGFLGGARHWLTLQTAGEFLIIRLEDRNVIRVLNGVEARTGSKVLRNQSE